MQEGVLGEGVVIVTNYQRGRDKEYEVIKILEKAGYTAFRTAGSHGVFDVIAINPLGTRFIQVKREKKPASYDNDIEAVQGVALPPHSTAELWVWRDGTGWVTQKIIKFR